MIILKEVRPLSEPLRQELEKELSAKSGDKVVIVPMCLEVVNIVHEPQKI